VCVCVCVFVCVCVCVCVVCVCICMCTFLGCVYEFHSLSLSSVGVNSLSLVRTSFDLSPSPSLLARSRSLDFSLCGGGEIPRRVRVQRQVSSVGRALRLLYDTCSAVMCACCTCAVGDSGQCRRALQAFSSMHFIPAVTPLKCKS